MKIYLKIIVAIVIFTHNLCAYSQYVDIFTPSRLNLIQTQLENFVRENSDVKVASICIVKDSKILLGKEVTNPKSNSSSTLINNDLSENTKYPLGSSTLPLISLGALEMQSKKLLDLHQPITKFCSYFTAKNGSKDITFMQLLSSDYAFAPSYDKMIPLDSSIDEIFSLAAQLPIQAQAYESKSALAAALAGYSLGYATDKNQKNLKKSFALFSKNYVFSPLNIKEQSYRFFTNPLFPARAYALSIQDTAKWLNKLTTDDFLQNFNSDEIAEKKRSKLGWLYSRSQKCDFFVSGDYFQNCANIIVFFPSIKASAAFFVISKNSSKSSEFCAKMLENLIEMISNPPKN